MPKALQKHALSHLPEGAEEDGGDTVTKVKAQLKKKDGKKNGLYVILGNNVSVFSTLHYINT